MKKEECIFRLEKAKRHLKGKYEWRSVLPYHKFFGDCVNNMTVALIKQGVTDKNISLVRSKSVLEKFKAKNIKHMGEKCGLVVHYLTLMRSFKYDLRDAYDLTEEDKDLVVNLNTYFSMVDQGVYKWLKVRGKPTDLRSPVGEYGVLGNDGGKGTEEYRFFENGVMQSGKSGVYVNMLGTTGTDNPVYHLSSLEGIEHLFVSRLELMVAMFMDDCSDKSKLWFKVKPDGTIEYTEEEVSKQKSRRKIYLDTGLIINKVRGKEVPIEKITSNVTREATDKLLKKIKKTLSNVDQLSVVYVKATNNISVINSNYIEGDKYIQLIDLKNFTNHKGTLRMNQPTFYGLIIDSLNRRGVIK